MNTFDGYEQVLAGVEPVGVAGRVSGVRGLTVSVSDFAVPLGAGCRIVCAGREIAARVIGFAGDQTVVMPMGPMTGICRGDKVELTAQQQTVPVSQAMLGRVLDGAGRPIDSLGPMQVEQRMPLWPEPIAPMRRMRITDPLPVGVRAIDSMLTVGRGQRMGILAGPGLGKSVLLGRIARYAKADAVVIALIGERGREVPDFVEKALGAEGLARSVVVVSTADEPPAMRVQAACVALCVAEHFRDRGGHVVLLMDSLTRLAAAQRQIGLVAGEPPATKGYTPSVFNLLPELLERCGRTEAGSITGFFTVLVEGEDPADPIAEAVRAATDGHICLSRELATRGRWPAIDVLASISRVMMDVATPEHLAAADEIRRLISLHREIEDLLRIGAYRRGSDPECDLAAEAIGDIERFLSQPVDHCADYEQTTGELVKLHEKFRAIRDRLAAVGGAYVPDGRQGVQAAGGQSVVYPVVGSE